MALDMTLFIRPFTPRSWLAIAVFVLIGALALIVFPKFYQLLIDQVKA